MFTPGTIGDQRTAAIEGDGAPHWMAVARHLASAGLDKMDPVPLELPLLETYEIEVRMPPVQLRVSGSGPFATRRLRHAVAARLLEEDLSVTRIQVVRLGPVLWIGVPCDLSASIGMPVLEQARKAGFVPVIMSMSNEWIGYVLTEEEYREASYKSTSQLHGPLTGPLFRALLLRVVDRLAQHSIDGPEAAHQAPLAGLSSLPEPASR